MEKKDLKYFSIPLKGLKNGSHHFQFDVRSDFFKHFENEVVNSGSFLINFELFKEDNVSTMLFEVSGKIDATCDRCTADIELPVHGEYSMLLKYGEVINSTDEVIYIDPETSLFSVADIIYECIILSIPIMKIYDCEDEEIIPCNEEVLIKLEQEENDDEASSSLWESLKDLDLNDN
jgi:uncharacterized metal-binding protein YceD (DUF177 family)